MREKFGRATSIFVADYRGLDVKQATRLRSELRSAGEGDYEYQVVKNSVLKRACDGADTEALSEHFMGPTAIAISYGDPAGLAKLLVDYSKAHEVFELKLRAQLVGLLNAPATKLVRLLNEPGGQLARLVKAREGALAEGGEG
jgi:large subunit ribosomal protein L10